MGILNRGTIVSEALLRAGNTSLTNRANIWLELWLQKQYASVPWPFLCRRIPNFALSVGTQSFLFGAGNGGEALAVQRVIDPILIYDSSYSTKDRIQVREIHDPIIYQDESVNNPVQFLGKPLWFKAIEQDTTRGLWKIIPTPFPDRAFILVIDYIISPAALTLDSQIPIYPNDETMIQAVVARAVRFMKLAQNEIDAEESMLRDETAQDRARYLTAPGNNDTLPLDSRFFRHKDRWW